MNSVLDEDNAAARNEGWRVTLGRALLEDDPRVWAQWDALLIQVDQNFVVIKNSVQALNRLWVLITLDNDPSWLVGSFTEGLGKDTLLVSGAVELVVGVVLHPDDLDVHDLGNCVDNSTV